MVMVSVVWTGVRTLVLLRKVVTVKRRNLYLSNERGSIAKCRDKRTLVYLIILNDIQVQNTITSKIDFTVSLLILTLRTDPTGREQLKHFIHKNVAYSRQTH